MALSTKVALKCEKLELMSENWAIFTDLFLHRLFSLDDLVESLGSMCLLKEIYILSLFY